MKQLTTEIFSNVTLVVHGDEVLVDHVFWVVRVQLGAVCRLHILCRLYIARVEKRR